MLSYFRLFFCRHRHSCLSDFQKLNPSKKEVLLTYREAVDEGRNLIEKLKEAGQEKPEEASYCKDRNSCILDCNSNINHIRYAILIIVLIAISLVNAWLDELQQSRIQWQSTLKKHIKQDKDTELYNGFEAELKQIEDALRKSNNLDVSPNRPNAFNPFAG